MAYAFMASIVISYIVMAHIVMAAPSSICEGLALRVYARMCARTGLLVAYTSLGRIATPRPTAIRPV